MTARSVTSLGKRAFCLAADICGLNALALPKNGDAVLVLAYHGVIADEYAQHRYRLPMMVTATEFRAQLSELLRCFTPITADEFRAWRHGKALPPRHHVLITFDDGYANNLHYAAPTLREFGAPATFFVSTGYIGTERILWPTEIYLRACAWPESRLPLPAGGALELPREPKARARFACAIEEMCKRLPSERRNAYVEALRGHPLELGKDAERAMFSFMTWDDVRALAVSGFTVGSHTVDHPILSSVDPSDALVESCESKAAVERELGTVCSLFAYPNGGRRDINVHAVRALRTAGYETAFTMRGNLCRTSDHPMLCDRVWIPGDIDLRDFRTRISGVHAAVQRIVGVA